MTRSVGIALFGTLLAVTIVAALDRRARSNVVTAGFWVEDEVTFELHDPARLGGPLRPEEQRRIEAVARGEIERAFAELSVRLTDRRDAFYRVAVKQVLTINRAYAASGQSNAFGPLGGYGAVSFVTLAAQAMTYAPPGASRAAIVDAIGRGIGRAAVHELAHQILPKQNLHASADPASYEYWSSDRAAQYYGEMRWSVARRKLEERLSRR